ncbi:hypothetical protein ACFYY2_13470 [Streptomyces sp. NPDC001822]|uniref:hypothetical protein n=1 Tax=Streptomyces sp. NPDC001822 TaxID=3364614 RepID=UPI00369B3820
MGYRNEDEIKRALGIESWRNLSKDKMIRFAAMMPDMGTEAALKIVEQFPAFKDLAKSALDAMKRAHESTLSADAESQEHVYRAFQDIRETLKDELNKDGLSWENRQFLIEGMKENGRQVSQKDTEHKKFLDGQLRKVLVGTGTALVLGVAFVGGKVMAEGNDSPEGSLEG